MRQRRAQTLTSSAANDDERGSVGVKSPGNRLASANLPKMRLTPLEGILRIAALAFHQPTCAEAATTLNYT